MLDGLAGKDHERCGFDDKTEAEDDDDRPISVLGRDGDASASHDEARQKLQAKGKLGVRVRKASERYAGHRRAMLSARPSHQGAATLVGCRTLVRVTDGWNHETR